jgi:hypothetical protein
VKAHIVYDVGGTVTNLHVEGDRITVHDLHERSYLVQVYDLAGTVVRALHVSLAYLVDDDKTSAAAIDEPQEES